MGFISGTTFGTQGTSALTKLQWSFLQFGQPYSLVSALCGEQGGISDTVAELACTERDTCTQTCTPETSPVKHGEDLAPCQVSPSLRFDARVEVICMSLATGGFYGLHIAAAALGTGPG